MCTVNIFSLCQSKVTWNRYNLSHLAEKADQNGKDSPTTGSNGGQENQAGNKDLDGTKRSSPQQNTLEEYKPKVTLAGHTDPTYYIGGGNGNSM